MSEFGVGVFDLEQGENEVKREIDYEEISSVKPRILLMGLQRSGKSSIQKVVFHKMNPDDTLLLESTCKIFRDDISSNSFINFQIWDIPGQLDVNDASFDFEAIFKSTGALIFVIDAQDDYIQAMNCLTSVVMKAATVNPNIKFETFIHKVDGLADDVKIETQRDISKRSGEDLSQIGVNLSYHLTSIYDHSIFEAFSKVVQKLIPQLSSLEQTLSIFVQNSGVERAFLFDVVSKIYIATDGGAVDMQSYELCCEMIDLMIDVNQIYGKDETGASIKEQNSTCIIKINNSNILYLREISRFLVLVGVCRSEAFNKRDIIDYNLMCLQNAILEVFNIEKQKSLNKTAVGLRNQQLLDTSNLACGEPSSMNSFALTT